MPLVECRECSGTVSTEAPTCPHCGVPSPAGRTGVSPEGRRTGVPHARPHTGGGAPHAGAGRDRSACPHCGSSHTAKATVAAEMGTQGLEAAVKGIGGGIGWGGGSDWTVGVGGATGTVTGKVQSQLADRLEPDPPKPGAERVWLVLGGILVLGLVFGSGASGGFLLFVLALLAGVLMLWSRAVKDRKQKQAEYRGAQARFAREWVCLRCGEMFMPGQ